MIARNSKPIPKRRAKPRRGPMRDPAYRAWLHSKPCACGCGRMPCHAAHTQNGGMRMKGPDSSCVPLYPACHTGGPLSYDFGRRAFEARHGVDMRAIAARYYAEYLAERGVEVV
jgi:hypothetical protein